ncbi:hypothetical protein [Candidatus Uabimicrobium sp. HlEnr_7]|uniref:hypothetical protein n=1 Tax=Candidatus Uabimicrobium helgolandensis TaxID=3095367 RepID=UPI0035569F9F
MIVYELDLDITFDVTNFYNHYYKIRYGMFRHPNAEKEAKLRSKLRKIFADIKQKFSTISYIKKQFDEIDNKLLLFDDSLFFEISKKVNDLHTLWKSESIEQIFYDSRKELLEEIEVLEEKIPFEKILEQRKEIGIRVQTECLQGQRIKIMNIDVCLPVFEHYREVYYQFRPGKEYEKEYQREKKVRLEFSQHLLDIVEILKSVKHQEDEVFSGISEDVQKYYDKWLNHFNARMRDHRYARQEYLEAMKVIIKVLKKELEKYKGYLADAEEEKKEILKSVESEKQQEFQAQVEIEKRNRDFEEEAQNREQVYKTDLNSQLLVIDQQLDKQFNDAVVILDEQHKREIEEMVLLYPQKQQKQSLLPKKINNDPQNQYFATTRVNNGSQKQFLLPKKININLQEPIQNQKQIVIESKKRSESRDLNFIEIVLRYLGD